MLTAHNCWCNFGRGHYESSNRIAKLDDVIEILSHPMNGYILIKLKKQTCQSQTCQSK